MYHIHIYIITIYISDRRRRLYIQGSSLSVIMTMNENKSINDAVLIRVRQTSSRKKNSLCNIYVNFVYHKLYKLVKTIKV